MTKNSLKILFIKSFKILYFFERLGGMTMNLRRGLNIESCDNSMFTFLQNLKMMLKISSSEAESFTNTSYYNAFQMGGSLFWKAFNYVSP
jgi:hypothetical protein